MSTQAPRSQTFAVSPLLPYPRWKRLQGKNKTAGKVPHKGDNLYAKLLGVGQAMPATTRSQTFAVSAMKMHGDRT